jgi:CPA2 family monovalent cation:H+ antiporter-2
MCMPEQFGLRFAGTYDEGVRKESCIWSAVMGIATDLVVIVLAALVGGTVAHLLRQPLICGFILAGVFVGPYTGGYTVEHVEAIEKLAEIGVALLLFTLGLEFSFGELRRLAKVTLIVTPLQIVLTSLIGYYGALWIGLEASDAMWLSSAIALSSTMVVLKTLSARDALESTEGQVMLAVLIAQDLAIVPLMLVLPQLSAASIDFGAIAAATGKSLIFLAAMYIGGTRILPRLFTVIAHQRSRELFFLSTLSFALGAGFLSHELGLSFALGAFVAGMLLSETDFNHQALSDVAHLRDLFAMIFFVSVGMLFNPAFLVAHLGTIFGLVGLIVVAKALIIAGLILVFGYGASAAVVVGLGLAQVGEFAFVVVNVGKQVGAVSGDSYSLMISLAVVSMVLTPSLFALSSFVVRRFKQVTAAELDCFGVDVTSLKGHVIIIGGGVVGRYVARVLSALACPHVVLELDYKAATGMRDNGIAVIFGDGSHRVVLEGAGLARASLVVITTTNDAILPDILAQVRAVRPEIPVIVRVQEVEDVETLSLLKIEEVVQPQLEVGLQIVRQSMRALKIDPIEIERVLTRLRIDRYEPGRLRS